MHATVATSVDLKLAGQILVLVKPMPAHQCMGPMKLLTVI